MPLCGAWVAVDRLADVGHEICFGASRPTRWTDHFSSDHIEVDHERQRAMANVLELSPLHLALPQRQAWRGPLQGLDASHFVGADHTFPGSHARRCFPTWHTRRLPCAHVLRLARRRRVSASTESGGA